MIVFFKDGRSVWFENAKNCEEEGAWFKILGNRNRFIAQVRLEHVAFWYYDNEGGVTTYGYAENANA